MNLFSLAVAAGLLAEAMLTPPGVGLLGPLLAAALFLAVPFAPTFEAAALLFLVLKAVKYRLLQPYSVAKHDLLPCLLLVLLLGARLLPRLSKRIPAPSEEDYLRILFLASGALYWEALFYKLAEAPLWWNGRLLEDLLRYRIAFSPEAAGASIAALGWVGPLSLFTLLTEATFGFASWVRPLRIPAALAAIALHLGIYLVLGVQFLSYQLGILLTMGWLSWRETRSTEAGRFPSAN